MPSPEVELQDKEPQIEMNQEWPGYARPWLLQELGVESKHVEVQKPSSSTDNNIGSAVSKRLISVASPS